MRKSLFALSLQSIAVTVAGCVAVPAGKDPASMVQAFFDALNAGDVDEAMMFIPNDA